MASSGAQVLEEARERFDVVFPHLSEGARGVVLGADYYEQKGQQRGDVPLGIGRNSTISGAIIDKNARIGERVVIRGAPGPKDDAGEGFVIRDGIVVVTQDSVISDGTEIG